MLNKRIFTCLLLTLAFGSTSSCFLKPKKKDNKTGGGATYRYLLTTPQLTFDRFGDMTQARLGFQTNTPAFCKMVFFPRELGWEPAKDARTEVACSNNEKKAETTFVEEISGLKTDTFYNVLLYIWPDGGNENTGELIRIEEPSLTPGTPDGKLTELFVARLNIPLREAEVHRHQLPGATEDKAIKAALAQTPGCTQGPISASSPFREALGDIKLTRLETRDFAFGQGKAHPDFPQIFKLSYPTIAKASEKWAINYTLDGSEGSVIGNPIGLFLNLEMESTETMVFPSPQLAETTEALTIDATKPLQFSWTTSKLPELSQVTVQIGRPERNEAIYCVFKAADLSGTVDAALLQNLPVGQHVVVTQLSSDQLWVNGGWLINTVDWRSSRIDKK